MNLWYGSKIIGENFPDCYTVDEALIACDYHLCRDYSDPDIVMAVKEGVFYYSSNFYLKPDSWELHHVGTICKALSREAQIARKTLKEAK
jgi:hypothetical protein